MLWVILIVFLISLISYLLFATISIVLDTENNRYYLKIKGLLIVHAESHKSEILCLRLQLYFLNFNFYPLRPDKKKLSKTKKKAKKSKRFFTFKKGIRLIKSFEIKQLSLDFDTGDCIANARLFPVFAFLNYKLGNFHLNFDGRNKLVLHIQNRPIYIIKSFINF